MKNIELLFLWLLIYSIIGWVYESILCSIEQKRIVNRGFLMGPYCPIYGCGAVLDILILGNVQNPILLFVLGLLVNCTLEYFTSWAMEKLFHARWWDYSSRKFNINGRVCLIGAIVFGTFSVLLIKLIHPFVISCTDMLSPLALSITTAVLFVVFVGDIVVTIRSLDNFDKKLAELSAAMEKLKLEAEETLSEWKTEAETAVEGIKTETEERVKGTHAYAMYKAFAGKLSKQHRRYIIAFPSMRSIRYNHALGELRKHMHQIIAEKLGNTEEVGDSNK